MARPRHSPREMDLVARRARHDSHELAGLAKLVSSVRRDVACVVWAGVPRDSPRDERPIDGRGESSKACSIAVRSGVEARIA